MAYVALAVLKRSLEVKEFLLEVESSPEGLADFFLMKLRDD
jgi:hypothetical protein